MGWPFSKMKKWKCADGSVKYTFKDADDAFPIYTKNWSKTMEATVRVLKGLNVSIGANFREQIAGFLVQIDRINASVQSNLRGVYVAYSHNPCEREDFLFDFVKRIVSEEMELRKALLKAKSLEKDCTRVDVLGNTLMDIQATLSNLDIPKKKFDAFRLAAEEIRAWIKKIEE